jgi:YD repeat-containing protein
MHSGALHATEIREVSSLVEGLGDKGIELRRYDYDPAFFGTFQLEFSKGHTRARLTWDGRERMLSVERATVQSQNDLARWQLIHELRQESSRVALAEVESQVLAALG